MFGYVVAAKDGLSEAEFRRYRACYCGLCHRLKEKYGPVSRMTLNYDMTFLILLLSSLYEPEEQAGERRCAAHPGKPQPFWQNEITDYAADMNVALTYYKLLDDWRDEGDRFKQGTAALLKKAYEQVRETRPAQCAAIEEELNALSALEKANDPVPDRAAACFGRLMAAVFRFRDDRWTPAVQETAFALGELIYLEDACVDMEKDAKRGRYNPLLALWGECRPLAECEPLLLMTAARCAEAFDRLPLVQDAAILKNILYSGVWTRYHQARVRREQGKTAAGEA